MADFKTEPKRAAGESKIMIVRLIGLSKLFKCECL